jgi:hypothetical protein
VLTCPNRAAFLVQVEDKSQKCCAPHLAKTVIGLSGADIGGGRAPVLTVTWHPAGWKAED